MDGKVTSGKRSGKKRRKSKTYRDRKRGTKSKFNSCNDVDETNSDSVLYSCEPFLLLLVGYSIV